MYRVAPHLKDFLETMRLSGYSETNQFQIIKSGVEDFDKIEKTEERPVNISILWEEDVRQKKKELQKRNWFRKGGYHVSLFLSHTPWRELVKRMKVKEAENNQGRNI